MSASIGATASTPAGLYVLDVFNDLLHRDPDADGLGYWTQQLASGIPAGTIAAQITGSAEYFASIITPAYKQFLGRAPDSDGLNYWIAQMQVGLSDELLQAGFIGSPEYYAHNGGTDQAWVDAMYRDLLQREPDASGQAFWVRALEQGADRSTVAFGFAASDEREAITVTNDYSTLLARTPASGDVDYWVSAFHNGHTNEEVVAGFAGSPEYYQSAAFPANASPASESQFSVNGTGLDPSAATTVVFTDRLGHEYDVTPWTVGMNSVVAPIPALLDQTMGETAGGHVSVAVRQAASNGTFTYPALHDLQISDLPVADQPLGSITDQFLSGMESYLGTAVQDYQAVLAKTNDSADFAPQLATVQALQQQVTDLHQELSTLIAGQAQSIQIGVTSDSNATPIILNADSLRLTDEVFTQIALAGDQTGGSSGGITFFSKVNNEAGTSSSIVQKFFDWITNASDNYDAELPKLEKMRDAAALGANLAVSGFGIVASDGLAMPEALAAGHEAAAETSILGSMAILLGGLALKESAAAIRGDNCADLHALVVFGAQSVGALGLDLVLDHVLDKDVIPSADKADQPFLSTFAKIETTTKSAIDTFTPNGDESQIVDKCESVIGVSPASFTFDGLAGTILPTQSMTVTNTGGSLSVLHYSITTSEGRILALGVNNALPVSSHDNYTVGIDTSNLAPGSYSGTITVQSTNDAGVAPVTVPVTVNLAAPPAVISATPNAMVFFSDGTSNPAPQALQIANVGPAFSALSFSVSTTSQLIQVAGAGSGTLLGGQGETTTVSVVTAGVAPGTYSASIFITSSDPRVKSVTVPLTITIASAAGIRVTPTSGLFTSESGGTAEFSVVLTSQPSAPVTVGIDTGDEEAVASVSSLTFTPSNWSIPQTVVLIGQGDDTHGNDGDENYTVKVGPPSSSDRRYASLQPVYVSVTSLLQ